MVDSLLELHVDPGKQLNSRLACPIVQGCKLRFYKQVKYGTSHFQHFAYTECHRHIVIPGLNIEKPHRSSPEVQSFPQLPEIKGLEGPKINVGPGIIPGKGGAPDHQGTVLKLRRGDGKGNYRQTSGPFPCT